MSAPLAARTTFRLVLLAFGLSSLTAIELAAGNGFLKTMLAGQLPWPPLVLVVLMVAAATGGIVNAFTATMRPEPQRSAGTAAAGAVAMTSGLAASQAVAKLPLFFFFGMSLAGDALFAYAVAFLLINSLRLTGRWVANAPWFAAGLVGVLGAAGFVAQSWMALDAMAVTLALTRDLAALLLPAGVLVATVVVKPLRLDPKSSLNSLLLRLPLAPEQRLTRRALTAVILGLFASAVLNLFVHVTDQTTAPWAGLTSFSLGFFGLAYLAFAELATLTGEQRQGVATAKLAPISAKRFLGRYLVDDPAWAATVGLKTTNFSIDHDPGGVLHGELPASIMQIRGEEIQRCVHEVLGPMYLHSYVVGHRIFGAADPETSIRPCIDTLRMFACLYLDAGPLVERRIKGLAELLPIIDPGLARALGPRDLATLIRRNQWFFHFDFGWLDQHVIHTPRSTRYDVRMATLSSRMRQAMMDHLEKSGGVGNFVWLGPEARERLIQEAPAMRNVVEICPIPLAPSARSREERDELLMFIIKFEQLIPRLQRYFDLDTMRRALLDFEPSPESARLLGLLGLQLAKSQTPEEVVDILAQISSVPWRGFREKDAALQIILKASLKLESLVSPGQLLSELDTAPAKALHEKLLEAVRAVGYPSQILHSAQVTKIALRDLATLREVAADPRHARFSEAWLLMATTDYSRYSPGQRQELLGFLAGLRHVARLAGHRLVQIKAVDAVASLGRHATAAEIELLKRAAAEHCLWFAEAKVDPDICCLLLDAHLFLGSHLRQNLQQTPAVVAKLDAYFQEITTELGANHPKVIAVMSRWQEFRAQCLQTPSAA